LNRAVALAADARVLLRMLRGMPAGADARSRLQAFYAPQAQSYDAFRERLLRGRAELIASLDLAPGARVVDLGAGTGRNLDHFGPRLAQLGRIDLVDLCPALLDQARLRAGALPNVGVIAADACTYRPEAPVDCVIFSYSLTMIPDWRRALANAVAMLGTGGVLAVVDFTVTPAQSALARRFWTLWFGHDGVRLDRAHVEALRGCLQNHRLSEQRAPVPYVPGVKVCYYQFVGTRG
jgi:S-adenosylmethionine-diacylgycerolhomoserine-N-methlytransferase